MLRRFRASHRARLGRVVGHGLQRLGRLARIALLAIFILSPERGGLHLAGQALERLKAADRRNLRNDTFDAAIVRGHLENMAAGIRWRRKPRSLVSMLRASTALMSKHRRTRSRQV